MRCYSRSHVREEVVRVRLHFARHMQVWLIGFKVVLFEIDKIKLAGLHD